MGTDHCYTDEENRKIASYLNNFDAISVREDSLKDELSRLTDKRITTTIDSTLLLSIDDYRNIAIYPKKKNYILYYQMEYNWESKYRVIEVAKELNCDILVIGGKKEKYCVNYRYFPIADVSPQAFVGYILNAKCVFASSFHGVALSVAMKKDFFASTNDFASFAESRHSIRWFSDELVNNDKLVAAIKLAQTAPSACNRQATKVKIITSEEGKRLCCSLQNGTRGFGEHADKWLLITTEVGAWSHMHHTSGILDGGIFIMNLLYALHYYGIVACPLNAHLNIKDRKNTAKKLGYSESETPIAFIVIGNELVMLQETS